MKKITSLVLTVLMICAICLPVMAAKRNIYVAGSSGPIPEGCYYSITIRDGVEATLDLSKVSLLDNNSKLTMQGDCTLELVNTGMDKVTLTATNVFFGTSDGGSPKIIDWGSFNFDLTFENEEQALAFYEALQRSARDDNIFYRVGNRVSNRMISAESAGSVISHQHRLCPLRRQSLDRPRSGGCSSRRSCGARYS